MNSKYFDLPSEKQKNLINAGYKAFSLYPYKKASMSIIAEEANISKSLLFYYFKNKKEYYLFLFETAFDFLKAEKTKVTEDEKIDLFELTDRSVRQRILIMHDYPCLMKFAARAYYESDPNVQQDLQTKKEEMTQLGIREILDSIDYGQLQDTSDAEVLVNIILFIAEGCMRGQEDLDSEKVLEILPLFQAMMQSLKNHYYKKPAEREETK
jgi:TetR/AcrR family transcriptional regulator